MAKELVSTYRSRRASDQLANEPKSGKQIERCVISTFREAEHGLQGDYRQRGTCCGLAKILVRRYVSNSDE